jgi:NADPH:quinone reductase
MRAVAVRTFGASPELLDLPPPEPQAGEVAVQLQAAGMNPLDWKIGEGIYQKNRPHVFPVVLGVDGAGTVIRAGPGVEKLKPGQLIFGQFLHDPVGIGTYAEIATVSERAAVAIIPSGLSPLQAAALPTSGMTARLALDALGLPTDASLLIVGASGGVGSFATPLAVHSGLNVIAVARANSADRLMGYGVVSVLDPATDLAQELEKLAPGGVDGALDLMSDAAGFNGTAGLVHRDGIAATTTFSAGDAPVDARGVRRLNLNLQPNGPLLERFAHDVAEFGLDIPVDRTIALAEAPQALAEIRAGRAKGKTVIRLP